MIGTRGKARVASWHKWLGLILTLPLLGWIVSSVAMMMVTMNAPNGLAGNYQLNPYNSIDVTLDSARISPTSLLQRLASEHGMERIYWLRLQSRGPHLWYTVKPTPSALAMVFDAQTGTRLDPLSDENVATVASEALVGARFESLEEGPEYNRYYDVSRVPAVKARVVGDQPATLVLSRDEGRTLRRLNAESGRFNWWYRIFHINQLSDHLAVWTTFLLTCASGVILLSLFGYQLFWWRSSRDIAPGRETQVRSRNLHRKFGAVVAGLLILEMGAGIYMWISFGPMEDPFRGKASINREWTAGIATSGQLADPQAVLRLTAAQLPASPHPVQAIEWRRFGDRDGWIVVQKQSELGEVFFAPGGERSDVLPVELAARIAQQEVDGRPTWFYVGKSSQLWMDLNRDVPAYRFRFDDRGNSDVYVAMANGQVLQRRSAFWRKFGPFLGLHMFSFTGKQWLDMSLLLLFQAFIVGSIVTGCVIQFAPKGAVEGTNGNKAGTSRRRMSFAGGDRAALIIGLVLFGFAFAWFAWRSIGNLQRDRAVAPAQVAGE